MNEEVKPKPPATPAAAVSPELKYVIGGYALVLAGIVGAILLAKKNDISIGVSEGFASFAAIYIVAQAIERFIQPFTGFAVKAKEKTETRNALATLRTVEGGTSTATAADAVVHERDLEQIQADRAMAFWALATFIALLICGALELGLIEAVADVEGAGDGFRYLDVVITGIAIGSGTKPLHDVIDFVQSKKEKANPPVAGAVA